MKVDFRSAVSNSWKFATNAKRFVLMTASLLVLISIILVSLLSLGKGITGDVAQIFQYGIGLVIVIIIGALYFVFIDGTFVHNYSSKGTLSKSAGYIKSRYLTLLLAMILTGIIGSAFEFFAKLFPSIAGAVISFIFSITLAIIFYFVKQEVIIGKKGVINSLEGSYNIFRKNVSAVILTLIVSAIISLLIIFVSAIPLAIAAIGPILSVMQGASIAAALSSVNIVLLSIGGIILIAGFSLASLVSIGINTDIYAQLRKKKK